VQGEPPGERGVHWWFASQYSPAAQSASSTQVPTQAPALHESGAQSIGAAGGQCPAPSQRAPGVATVPLHDGARQSTVEGGNPQVTRLAPSQAPLHTVPSPGQAARGDTGAPVTGVHTPDWFTLHASHWPVQAVSQHAPSAQKPDKQSAAEAQGAPSGEAWPQVPATQCWLAQSASCMHGLPVAPRASYTSAVSRKFQPMAGTLGPPPTTRKRPSSSGVDDA
jgi:hypothetical protein